MAIVVITEAMTSAREDFNFGNEWISEQRKMPDDQGRAKQA
jgi:hypothetical protein